MARIVFSGGSVFDGTGSPASEADVAVEDGRIVAIGGGLDGDTSVDCAGRTVLPGLFDCHTHVMFSHIDFWRALQEPFSLPYFGAIGNLRKTLEAGITSVRDAGGADLGTKTAVERGLIPGPRMQISISMLSQTGGHADGWMPCGTTLFDQPVPGIPANIVDGPDEMRRRVRELVRAGADVIKVATSGGVLSPRDKPTHAHFRDAELTVLVEEATAAGLWVMAHAQATEGIKAAVRNGIRSIEHGIYLDDEAIAMMLEHGTFLVPTLVAPQGVLDAVDAGAQIPEESVRKAREVMEIHRDSFKRAVAAGVKVAMGTDSGVTPHGGNLRELALMAEFGGMSPADVLAATTARAAELLGVDEDLGTIEEGKRADLVVLGGDLAEFGTVADRIEAVYLDGARVR
jgi:imidazolonepropionase-like amidohydrolase